MSRELDEQVHVEVMGKDLGNRFHTEADWEKARGMTRREDFWRCRRCRTGRKKASRTQWDLSQLCVPSVPAYSTDISAAMTVVFAMRARGFLFELQNPPGWLSVVKREQAWAALFWIDESQRHTMAATAPEAICRAALAALSTAQNGPERANARRNASGVCSEAGTTDSEAQK